jgi:hypothetical protein
MLAGAAPFRPPPPAVRERCLRACPRPFLPVRLAGAGFYMGDFRVPQLQ